MKKTIFSMIVVLAMFSLVFAGGLVTNTNQSASFMRSLNRNASTDLDAAFFNPAGLTQLNDGMHLYLSNQSIYQTRTVISDNANLNNGTYEGETNAPVFPNAYFIFKTGNLAFAGGFAPIGGGGSAEFKTGLPSFETGFANYLPSLAAAGVTGYSLDASFEGSSTYLGFQGTVSYKLNDAVSVAFGGRMVTATNEYKGHLKDILYTTGSGNLTLGTILGGVAAQYSAVATGLEDSVTKYQTLSDYYAGLAATFQGAADAVTAAMTANSLPGATPLATLEAVLGSTDLSDGLSAAGVDPTGFTLDATVTAYSTLATSASGGSLLAAGGAAAYSNAADSLNLIAAGYTANAAEANVLTADLAVDAEQKGTAFAPIFGINIKASDKINVGIRYEGVAKLEMETKNDGTDPRFAELGGGFLQDGVKTNADMPGMLGAGIAYQISPKLNLQSSFNYYFNSNANWDGKEKKTSGGWEAGLSAHYALTNSLELSGGYLTGDNGAFNSYNSDLSHSLQSETYALGFKMALGSSLFVESGYASTLYDDGTNAAGNETYKKTSNAFAIGVGLSL